MPLPAIVLKGPAEHRVHPDLLGTRDREPGSGSPPPALLSPRPSSRRRARRPGRRSRATRSSRPRSSMSGSMPAAKAFNENALVLNAVATLSHSVCMKLPPRASCGANAIACRNPSNRPHRLAKLLAHGRDLVGLVDVHLQHVGRLGQPSRHLLCEAHRASEVGEHDLGALLLRGSGRGERDRLRRQHPRDEQLLVVQQHGHVAVDAAGVGVPRRQR